MPSTGRARLCGDDLIGIDVSSVEQAQTLAENLRASGDWLEVVVGIDSVVLQFDAAVQDASTALQRAADSIDFRAVKARRSSHVVEIPVRYGGEYGPDMGAVCAQLGLDVEEFVALHTSGRHSVDMLGFTPGFAYISGLDDRLRVPRLAEPRAHVPAGSVGIADGRSGLYALPGPGGWSLIGRTEYPLFDPWGEDPFALRPGTTIRFVAVDAS